jgi:hypothetical protein
LGGRSDCRFARLEWASPLFFRCIISGRDGRGSKVAVLAESNVFIQSAIVLAFEIAVLPDRHTRVDHNKPNVA